MPAFYDVVHLPFIYNKTKTLHTFLDTFNNYSSILKVSTLKVLRLPCLKVSIVIIWIKLALSFFSSCCCISYAYHHTCLLMY